MYRFGPSGTGDPIGTVAYRDPRIDYVVIELNPDAVLSSDGPEARIDSLGPAHPDGMLCKAGVRTGLTCGPIYGRKHSGSVRSSPRTAAIPAAPRSSTVHSSWA